MTLKAWDAFLDSLAGQEAREVARMAIEHYGVEWASRMCLRTDWGPEQRRAAESLS